MTNPASPRSAPIAQLREVIAEWRAWAENLRASHPLGKDAKAYADGRASVFLYCANQLDALAASLGEPDVTPAGFEALCATLPTEIRDALEVRPVAGDATAGKVMSDGASYPSVDRVVPCPDCHRNCGWCAWYAKNARGAGCGLSVPSGMGKSSKRRCEWEALRGQTCQACGGSEKVRLVGHYEPLKIQETR